MLTITRKLEFDAGHRIPDHKSQCRNLHGHRYTLEITLTGNVIEVEGSSDNGMIMDFSDVKALAKEHLVDVWDHAFLVYEKDHAVKEFLVAQGVAAGRMETVSYGKERPICSESGEDCWSQNRRGVSVITGGVSS